MAYIRQDFDAMTCAECEVVAERFMEIIYRLQSNKSNHLNARQAIEKLNELYDDARSWVSDRRMAA